jgi:hypothetical protein
MQSLEHVNQSIDMDIDSNMDMDMYDICNKMSNSRIYDERQEVFDSLNLKFAGKSDLLKADERYMRYLRDIEVWDIYEESYEYVRENIKKYLSIETTDKNLLIKLKMMRMIDKQFKHIIELVE